MRQFIRIFLTIPTLCLCACAAAIPNPALPTQPGTASLPSAAPIQTEEARPAPALPSATPVAPIGDRGPVYLDSAELLVLESFPPQYRLALKGNLPDPCHELRVEIPVPDAENRIDIQVFSLADPGRICIQVLEPFEESFPLEGLTAGDYQVSVNGKSIGQVNIPAETGGHSLKGFELYAWKENGDWVFSLLIGTNREKTLGEVTDPAATLPGVEALLKKLGQLQAGEVVTLMPLPGVNDPAIIPAELIDQIRTACRDNSLTCQFPIH